MQSHLFALPAATMFSLLHATLFLDLTFRIACLPPQLMYTCGLPGHTLTSFFHSPLRLPAASCLLFACALSRLMG